MERLRRQIAYKPQDGGEECRPKIEEIPESDGQNGEAGVQVISGANLQTLPLAGMQVTQARDVVSTILRVDARSPVLVNGREPAAGYRLACGDTLEFVHHAGEKGAGDGNDSRDRR